MSTLSIVVVVAIVALILVWGFWFTYTKFKNIEKGETNRRRHIDKDMKVDENKNATDREG